MNRFVLNTYRVIDNWLSIMSLRLHNKDVCISKGCKVRKSSLSAHVTLGKNVNVQGGNIGFASYLGENVSLPFTKIGKYCSIASNVKLAAGMHPSEFVSTHPATYTDQYRFHYGNHIEYPPYAYTDETGKYYCDSGNDVWIATGVLLVCGKNSLHIGDGAILRSGGVITRDVPPYAIVQGVPARIIGYRFSEQIISKLMKIRWWDQSEEWIKKHIKYFSDPEKLIEECEKEGQISIVQED